MYFTCPKCAYTHSENMWMLHIIQKVLFVFCTLLSSGGKNIISILFKHLIRFVALFIYGMFLGQSIIKLTCWSIFYLGFVFTCYALNGVMQTLLCKLTKVISKIEFFFLLIFYFLLNPKNVYTSFNFQSITHHLTSRV